MNNLDLYVDRQSDSQTLVEINRYTYLSVIYFSTRVIEGPENERPQIDRCFVDDDDRGGITIMPICRLQLCTPRWPL